MKIDNIGFYTLKEERLNQLSKHSPMWRCEILLTPKCNFRCVYCKGFENFSRKCGEMDFYLAKRILSLWIKDGLKNVRFSGGEPTLYPNLVELVKLCKIGNVERIAVSTNGSADFSFYKELIDTGVNDFSISLDACCSTFADRMAGTKCNFDLVCNNIEKISALTYTTVGIVLNEDNISQINEIVTFAHNLGASDIRIISSAQYNKLPKLTISEKILAKHPILKYRIENLSKDKGVRGIQESDSHKCKIVIDDSVAAGKWHFPCVIYLREGGEPIGEIGPNMRQERIIWSKEHNTFEDSICRKNCLDCLVDYNNKGNKIKGIV